MPLDWKRVLAAVPPAHLDWLERTAVAFGLPPWGWWVIPGLLRLTRDLAVVTLRERYTGVPVKDATAQALEHLGLEDDTDRATSPADSFAWKLRSWRRAEKSLPPPFGRYADLSPVTPDEDDDGKSA